jgi:hypothetical protein
MLPLITIPGGNPVTEVPGLNPKSPSTMVGPVFVTVDPAIIAKSATQSRSTPAGPKGQVLKMSKRSHLLMQLQLSSQQQL